MGASLLCAGRTAFGTLKYSGAQAGEVVSIHGFGGQGHLALQYVVKIGFKTVVLSRGPAKEALARQPGAYLYIDTVANNAGEELKKLGGAKAIICLAPNSKEISILTGGLGQNGNMVIITGLNEPLVVPPNVLPGHGRSITGFAGGDLADTLDFSLYAQMLPLVEVFPLEQAAEAYEKMLSSKVHFRAVLTMNNPI